MVIEKKNESFIENSYVLIIGQMIAEIISIIGTITTIRFTTVQEFSLLNIAYTFPYILTLVGELGLNYASIHYIAKFKKENNEKDIRNVIRITIKIKIIVSALFVVGCALITNFLATVVYGVDDIELQYLMYISILAVVGNTFYELSTAYFIGMERMKIVRIGQIMRATIRTFLIISLFLLEIRPYAPMIAYSVAPTIVAIFNLIMIKKTVYKVKISEPAPKSDLLKKMVQYGYPLLIVSTIIGLQTQIFTFIFTSFHYYDAISYFNVAINCSAIILVFTISLTNSLFPFFSKLDWKRVDEKENLRKDYKLSLTLSNSILLPITVLFIVFASEIFPLIFGDSYIPASNYISFYLATFSLASFGSISLPAFFNGQGRTKFVFYVEFLKLTCSVIFGISFTTVVGPIGVLYGIFTGHCISVITANIFFYIFYEKKLLPILKKSAYYYIFCFILGFGTRLVFDLISRISIFDNILLELLLVAVFIVLFIAIWYLSIRILSLLSTEDFQLIIQTLEPIPILNKFIGILVKLDLMIFSRKGNINVGD